MNKTVHALAGVTALAVLAALVTVLGATHPAPVGATAAAAAVPAPGLVIGDSMTERSQAEILTELPGWEVDGVGGRPVADLIPILREYKATHGTVPPVVVIALGSNEETYFRRLYQYAVDMLPAETTVVFQSLWRDPDKWRSRARTMGRLTEVMRGVAGRRELTCVAGWRARARRGHDVLISDGVHPTLRGRQVWAQTVRRAVERCV